MFSFYNVIKIERRMCNFKSFFDELVEGFSFLWALFYVMAGKLLRKCNKECVFAIVRIKVNPQACDEFIEDEKNIILQG